MRTASWNIIVLLGGISLISWWNNHLVLTSVEENKRYLETYDKNQQKMEELISEVDKKITSSQKSIEDKLDKLLKIHPQPSTKPTTRK